MTTTGWAASWFRRANRKITCLGRRAAASGGAEPDSRSLSGGWDKGDSEPRASQVPDVAAGLPGCVGAVGVVAGAEIAEARGPAGEQVPEDDQDGAGDGDERSQIAAAAGDPPVALAEESVGAGGRGLAEDGLEAGIALAGPPGAGPAPRDSTTRVGASPAEPSFDTRHRQLGPQVR